MNARWILERSPGNAPSLVTVAAAIGQKSTEVVLSTKGQHEKATGFLKAFNQHARPSDILSWTDTTGQSMDAFLGLRGKAPGDSGFRAYVCHDRICHQPTEDIGEFIQQLKANPNG